MSLEVQVARPLSLLDVEPEPPAPTGPLDVLRRAWRDAESAAEARAPGAVAGAGQLGRAVGALVLAAGTNGPGAAEFAAEVGCASGVARMVEVALARMIVHALPTSAESSESSEPQGPAARPRPAAPAVRATVELPPPGWWERDPPIENAAPRWVPGRCPDPEALWPAVPPSRLMARVVRPSRRPIHPGAAVGPDRNLLAAALRTLESELEPQRHRRHGGGAS